MAEYAISHIQPLGSASGIPFFWEEFGLSAAGPTDGTTWWTRDAANVHVHNAMWASAVSGAAGGAMHWWWHEFDDHNAYLEFGPVRTFVNRLPLLNRTWIFIDSTPETPQARCNTTAIPSAHFNTAAGKVLDHFVATDAVSCEQACCNLPECDGWVYTTSQVKGSFAPCQVGGKCCWLKENVGAADILPFANTTAGVERGVLPWSASGIIGHGQSLKNDTFAMWLRNPSHTWEGQQSAEAQATIGPISIPIPNMQPGSYLIEIIDTTNGNVSTSLNVVVGVDEILVVPTPPFKRDCALFGTRQGL